MDKRIQQFLSAENITQSQLADTLGVARASVSHILAGRNKPSFDFIESIASHYPSVNLDWLITGNGRMYKDSPAASSGYPADLFDKTAGELANTAGEPAKMATEQPETQLFAIETPPVSGLSKEDSAPSDTACYTSTENLDNKQQNIENTRVISKIVIFYSDGTYKEVL